MRVAHEEVDIRTLTVERVNESEAHARLDASLAAELVQPDGSMHSMILDYSGPARLVRTRSGWKVADYYRDGRSVLDAIVFPEDAVVSSDDLVVAVRAVELEQSLTTAVFEWWNGGPNVIELTSARLTFPGWLRRRWEVRRLTGETRIPPGGRIVNLAAWLVGLPVRTRRLNVAVRGQQPPDNTGFVFALAVELPELENRRGALQTALDP